MKNREGRLWRLTVKTRHAVVEFMKQLSLANNERWQGVSLVGGLFSAGLKPTRAVDLARASPKLLGASKIACLL